MDKITAPFTPEAVEGLKIWQNGYTAGHPFTCCGFEDCKRDNDQGILIPREEGWICPCGKYTQDWYHAGMEHSPYPITSKVGLTFAEIMLKNLKNIYIAMNEKADPNNLDDLDILMKAVNRYMNIIALYKEADAARSSKEDLGLTPRDGE